MQADGRLPPEQQVYKYTNIANGLTRIVKEEGLLALWRGCSPTVVRYVEFRSPNRLQLNLCYYI